jgi:hypothetical protein
VTDELPRDARRLFAHYEDTAALPDTSPTLVLAKLMEEGDVDDLHWLTSACSEADLATWLDTRGPRQLSRRSLAFWRLMLDRPDDGTAHSGDELWPL